MFPNIIIGLLAHVFHKVNLVWSMSTELNCSLWMCHKSCVKKLFTVLFGQSAHTSHVFGGAYLTWVFSKKIDATSLKKRLFNDFIFYFKFVQCICVVYCLCSKSAFNWAVLTHYTVGVYSILRRASLKHLAMFTCPYQSK